MSSFPGPVHSDKTEEAEARRRALRNRFRAVSRGIDRRGGGADGNGGGLLEQFSPFELALGVAGIAFAVWAVLRLSGGL